MSKVAKSLSDLDALADEVLSKSVKEDNEDLKPEEISENVPDDASKDAPENDAPAADASKDDDVTDDKKETEDGADEDLEKCDASDDVIKSDDSEPVSEDVPEEDEDDKDELEKSEDLEDDSDVEEEDEADIDNKEDLEKSIHSDFVSNEEIKNGMDASEFLSSVVEILSKSLADTVGEIQINRADNNQNTSILAKSLQATLNLNKSLVKEMDELKKENDSLKKSITDGFNEIKSSLEEVLAQPVGMRKSVKNIQVMDRNFQKSLNGDAAAGMESLSKSQIMDILVTEMHAGNQAVTAGDIVAFESGAPLHAGLVALVNSKCK